MRARDWRWSVALGLVVGFVGATARPAAGQGITEIIDAMFGVLDTPSFITVNNANGDVYVSAFLSDRLFRIEPNGTITTVIDATGDGVTQFRQPSGVVTDAANNVYVAGNNFDQVWKIEPNGTKTLIATSTGDGQGNFMQRPNDVAIDSSGNIFVNALVSDNAFKIEPNGTITEIIDATGDGSGNALEEPSGIATDTAGNVYVAGSNSDNVFKIEPNGTITEIIDAAGDGLGNPLDKPARIATDAAGNVYVAGIFSNNAFKIEPNGTITEIIDATGDGGGNTLGGGSGVATDPAGNVYVSGRTSDNVFKIAPNGTITEIIDATGDGQGNGLDLAEAVATDNAGNVYVVGLLSDNAFKIEPAPSGVEIFTDQAAFLAAVTPSYLEDFDRYADSFVGPIEILGPPPQNPGYRFDIKLAQPSVGNTINLTFLPPPTDNQVRPEVNLDTVVFSFPDNNIFAVGGFFFAQDGASNPVANEILVDTDQTDPMLTGGGETNFLGFKSDVPFEFLSMTQAVAVTWPTADDLIIGGGPPLDLDSDGDEAADDRDNCTEVSNPRVGMLWTDTPQQAHQTTTGRQLDDDVDGFGNACDSKFGTGGQFVGGVDVSEHIASFNKNVSGNNCGTTGDKSCSQFDLDGQGQFIGGTDIGITFGNFNQEPGPKCDACPRFCDGTACP